MAKCTHETHPTVFGYLEAYGMSDRFIAGVDRIKANAHYLLVGALIDGEVHMCDLSPTPDNSKEAFNLPNAPDLSQFGYSTLNDAFSPITEAEWNKVELDPWLETFTIPGLEEYC